MADNKSARTRLLLLIDIFKVYSNESNVLSIEEICSHLETYGFEATKRSIIADIKSINTTPYKIIYVTKPKKGYYITRDFTLSSADALVTAVYSSDMLSHSERINAQKALRRILSIPSGDLLLNTTERVSVEIPREPVSWENIMTLRHAIAQKKKVIISYAVTRLGDSFDSSDRIELMTVNPVKIAISTNSTLLVFTQPGKKDAECIHLCRIKEVEILDEDSEEYVGDISNAVGFFTSNTIKNRHKTAAWVLLKIKQEDAEFVRNFFDSPVQLKKSEDSNYCYAKVYTVLDEKFIGWILCFGDKIEIIAPQKFREYFIDRLKSNILLSE